MQYGTIKEGGVRVGADDKGECKGYAFVEFEDEVRSSHSRCVHIS